MEEIRVVVVDDVAETRENLRKLLSFEPDIDVVGAAGSGVEGIELAKQVDPHVVLMDINMPGMDGITATEELLQAVPSAAVVMLSVQGESDYLRRAMLAGARDYLTKPASADELVNTIHRVFEMAKSQRERAKAARSQEDDGGEQERGKRGDVVAVFAPKGGAGCTTVAINTAVVLQEFFGTDRQVALLDGNLQFGDVGVMLDLRPDRSIADLSDRIGELDGDLLGSVMSAHGSGIKVLLAPPRPEAAESLLAGSSNGEDSSNAVAAVLDKMRDNFDVVVADVWSWVDDVTLTLFDAASVIVVVLTPDIPAVKSTRLFLELARKLNYDTQRILLVLNRSDQRGRLQVDQIEKAIMEVTAEIPFDEGSAVTAANRGVPVVQRDRSRPMSESIVDLAKVIHSRLADGDEEISSVQKEEPKGIGGTGLLRLRKALRGG